MIVPRASLMLALMALLAPFVVVAQGPRVQFGGIGSTFATTLGFINCYLVPLIFAIAFLIFIWGLVNFLILGAASDDKRKSGKQLILWGVAGFVLMVSLWGIVAVLADGLGFRQEGLRTLPSLPGQSYGMGGIEPREDGRRCSALLYDW